MRRSVSAALLAAAVLLAGCSESSPSARPTPTVPAGTTSVAPAAGPTRIVVAASEGPKVSPGETRGSTAAPTDGATPSPNDSYPDHAPGTRQAPLSIELATGCVRPGGSQTITIRSKPKLQLAWATLYSDGSGHQEYGGWGTAIMPPSGLYTKTWVLPPNAPVGDARTDVTIAGTIDGEDWTALGRIFWRIAADC